MEFVGMCDVCGKLTPQYTCALCGARVCIVCYDEKGKSCKNCAGGRKIETRPEKTPFSEETEEEDGIDDLFK
jgi:hypothetical protein